MTMADSVPGSGDDSASNGAANHRPQIPPLPSGYQNGNGQPRSRSMRMNRQRKQSPSRPSTWPIFLVHFALPVAFIALLSTSDVVFERFEALSPGPTPPVASRGNDMSTKPSHVPTTPPSNNFKYQQEINEAIERKKKRQQPLKSTMSSESLDQQRSKHESRPRGPQSTPLYQQMEARIKELRDKYEASHGTPSEYLVAIQYADFLKYRDATINDGGTHQMEAIHVYSRAIDLLEAIWRDKMAKGEGVRLPEIPNRNYEGLSQEMFLDYDSKSIEGILCATHTNLGKVYFMANMFERAVQSYEECLSYDHNYLDSLASRGQTLIILGKYDEAGRDYKHLLEKDHDRVFIDAITGMAKVLTAKEGAIPGGWNFLTALLMQELPLIEHAHDQSKSSNNNQGIKHYADALKRMHHAMFAYHDVKTKNASEAWKHLSAGNQYKISTIAPFDAETEKIRVSKVLSVFVPNFFPEGIGSQTRTPIFIIGFVRSGSTLLERILDAHPLIVGTGEDSVFNGRLDTIRNEIVKASMAGDHSVLQKKVKQLADDVVTDMKARWEVINANLHSEDGEKDENDDSKSKQPYPARFSDKMLTNYYNVGFIHMLFPNALILHVAREPMDSIFSAFKHDFPPGNLDYTSEFAGLAQLYHSYRDVMEHWDKVLPGRVTHVRYEDLVTDLPNVAPKLLKAAGVPWDPSVLEFHKKRHAVNTLSTTQVRKGVYSHHLKGWKRYEQFLQPLLDLVGDRVKYDLKTTLPGYKPE
ncbi:hypothetical protein ACHAWF_010845 [Thalassiosira exigua]